MHDLAGLATAVHRSGYLHVLPNARLGGFGGPEGNVRGWYERGGNESPEAVRHALAALHTFALDVRERYGVAKGGALLLGFSQGGDVCGSGRVEWVAVGLRADDVVGTALRYHDGRLLHLAGKPPR
jgi:predicted esterase